MSKILIITSRFSLLGLFLYITALSLVNTRFWYSRLISTFCRLLCRSTSRFRCSNSFRVICFCRSLGMVLVGGKRISFRFSGSYSLVLGRSVWFRDRR